MSESGLLRFYIIASELSVIAYIESNFTNYQNWFNYYKQMINSEGKFIVTGADSLGKILIRLQDIYGFSFEELTTYLRMFFNKDGAIDYYEFSKYSYKLHIS